jgi:RNA polymerase sigma-70 factor, ECF subfamily
MSLPSAHTIQLAQNGDRNALDDLITAIRPLVQRQLTRYPVTEDDKQDLLQTTLLQIVRRLDSFRGESSFTTWLFRVTANEALMLMRSQRRHRSRLLEGLEGDELDAITHDAYGFEEPFGEAHDRAEHLRAALASLPKNYQTVVAAHYGQDLGLQEIAQRFDMTEASVRSRLHRARARLRSVLADQQVGIAA